MATVPGTPTIVSFSFNAGGYRNRFEVVFNRPADGGSPIYDYEYRLNGGPNEGAIPQLSALNPAIGNGWVYSCGTYYIEIRAVNAIGAGPWSAPSSTASIPGTLPAIEATGVSSLDSGLIVFWSPSPYVPNVIMCPPLTRLDYSIDGGITFGSDYDTVGGVNVTGLTNGTTYTVIIRGVNALGEGAWTSPLSGTPSTTPSDPTIVSLTPGNGTLQVAFTAPVSDGGAAITSYRYSLNNSPSWNVAGSTTSPFTISGLTNGTTYSVRIAAVNIKGQGNASDPLSSIVGLVPTAPTITTIAPGATSLTVSYTAPSSQGTNPITRYEYSLDEGATFSSIGLTNPYTIEGLTTSQLYSITLRAVNIVGAGPWSTPASGIPGLAPSAPTITSVLPAGDGTLSVAYTAPSSDGGAAITAYEYSLDGGSNAFYADFPLNPFFITGLANGTTYSIVIRAINSIGDGAWSAPVQGTPLAVPSEPLIDIVTAENNALSVAYTAPVSDGGSPITSYQYSFDGGTNVVSVGLTNPLPISGLTNGQLYTIILRAVNALGAGPWSAPAYAMPTSGQKVFALGDRFIRVAFDSTKPAPVHVSSTGEKDILNPRSWNVLQLYSDRSGGRVLTGLSVKQLDNWTYELLMLQPFLREGSEYKDFTYGAVHVSGTGQVSLDIAFEDSSVAVINQNCSISIASVNANNTAQAVSRGYALKDIANVSISPLVSELGGSYYEFLGGTLLINSAGDYAGMDGEALLRKLIMRRLISRKGDFFHLPDYGANLAVKGVFSTANLPSLAKDIERQVEQEPDVEKAKVTLTYQAATSILVVQVQARMRSTGQQTGLSMSLPLSGTKSF